MAAGHLYLLRVTSRQSKRIISAAAVERIADTNHDFLALNAGVDSAAKEPPRTPSDARALTPRKSCTHIQALSVDTGP